ncbi:phenylalanine--tRNA ligase, chloroplastic/mitochondrial-like isoform X2 [Camellia sinensis]|uniref:phenylalanine--tRNA ligase, chloroplastic/mitochondrial-like isoform X2 n=1 Tax=Camellia sinensis TaxID=4442 RepID=UPI0010364BB9|nr:phenylalanine--tRNA ligase, chloroplastic/mitochondrial-like isoform X2 [Camellia sinensis]
MAASSVRRHRAACDGGKRATAARHVSLQLSHLLNLLRPHAHRFTKQKAKTNSHRLCVRQSSDKLHRRDHHPIGILKNAIYNYFDITYSGKFDKFDNLFPFVSVKMNFDDVLVPEDHVSRSYNDTYYVDSQTVLRCHICAHQAELLRKGHTHFLVTGDVYRRDSIDSTHRPVFHQMEGFRVFTPDDWEPSGMDGTSYVAEDLKKCLEGLARHLFVIESL